MFLAPRFFNYAKNDNKPFEIFQRAVNANHFERIKRLLKIISKQELVNKFEQAKQLHGPRSMVDKL